jgi:hypothetical protein
MKQGWLCPSCGSSHSPDTATCPNAASYEIRVAPLRRKEVKSPPDCGCPLFTQCHSTACPRRTQRFFLSAVGTEHPQISLETLERS